MEPEALHLGLDILAFSVCSRAFMPDIYNYICVCGESARIVSQRPDISRMRCEIGILLRSELGHGDACVCAFVNRSTYSNYTVNKAA